MTNSEFILKAILLAAKGNISNGATLDYQMDLNNGRIYGSFSFPVAVVDNNGELAIKSTEWLTETDFSSLKGV